MLMEYANMSIMELAKALFHFSIYNVEHKSGDYFMYVVTLLCILISFADCIKALYKRQPPVILNVITGDLLPIKTITQCLWLATVTTSFLLIPVTVVMVILMLIVLEVPLFIIVPTLTLVGIVFVVKLAADATHGKSTTRHVMAGTCLSCADGTHKRCTCDR